MSPNAEQCVEFYYYQTQTIVGRLNVYAKLANESINSVGFPLWTEMPIFNSWQVVQIQLDHAHASSAYQIIFEEYLDGNAPGISISIILLWIFSKCSTNLLAKC